MADTRGGPIVPSAPVLVVKTLKLMQRFFDFLSGYWEQLPEFKTILLYILAGWVLAPIVQFVERFLWSDWEFAAFLGILIMLDTLTGFIMAWQRRNISSQRFQRLFMKLGAYSVLLITLHVLSHHTIAGKPNSVMAMIVPYFDALVYAAILFREALSINENLTRLGYPILPPFITAHLERFQEHGLDTSTDPASSSNS